MAEEQFRAWITKYALTRGIQEMSVRRAKTSPDMVATGGGYTQYFHGEGREWHRTLESARARAEAMRKDKLASLRKQIARLERLSFDAPQGDGERA